MSRATDALRERRMWWTRASTFLTAEDEERIAERRTVPEKLKLRQAIAYTYLPDDYDRNDNPCGKCVTGSRPCSTWKHTRESKGSGTRATTISCESCFLGHWHCSLNPDPSVKKEKADVKGKSAATDGAGEEVEDAVSGVQKKKAPRSRKVVKDVDGDAAQTSNNQTTDASLRRTTSLRNGKSLGSGEELDVSVEGSKGLGTSMGGERGLGEVDGSHDLPSTRVHTPAASLLDDGEGSGLGHTGLSASQQAEHDAAAIILTQLHSSGNASMVDTLDVEQGEVQVGKDYEEEIAEVEEGLVLEGHHAGGDVEQVSEYEEASSGEALPGVSGLGYDIDTGDLTAQFFESTHSRSSYSPDIHPRSGSITPTRPLLMDPTSPIASSPALSSHSIPSLSAYSSIRSESVSHPHTPHALPASDDDPLSEVTPSIATLQHSSPPSATHQRLACEVEDDPSRIKRGVKRTRSDSDDEHKGNTEVMTRAAKLADEVVSTDLAIIRWARSTVEGGEQELLIRIVNGIYQYRKAYVSSPEPATFFSPAELPSLWLRLVNPSENHLLRKCLTDWINRNWDNHQFIVPAPIDTFRMKLNTRLLNGNANLRRYLGTAVQSDDILKDLAAPDEFRELSDGTIQAILGWMPIIQLWSNESRCIVVDRYVSIPSACLDSEGAGQKLDNIQPHASIASPRYSSEQIAACREFELAPIVGLLRLDEPTGGFRWGVFKVRALEERRKVELKVWLSAADTGCAESIRPVIQPVVESVWGKVFSFLEWDPKTAVEGLRPIAEPSSATGLRSMAVLQELVVRESKRISTVRLDQPVRTKKAKASRIQSLQLWNKITWSDERCGWLWLVEQLETCLAEIVESILQQEGNSVVDGKG